MTAPYVLTIPMTQAAKENAEAVQAVRDWCQSTADMTCSHTTEDECRRCEVIKDCALAVRALLPSVPPAAGEAECETASSDP